MKLVVYKDIPGYEGLYQISEEGFIKSFLSGKILKATKVNKYLVVVLCKNKSKKYFKVHRLVAETFIPNPDNLPLVLHNDNDPGNPHKNNLRWGTHQDNMKQMYEEKRHLWAIENPKYGLGKSGKDSPTAKKVAQYDKNGMQIAIFESISEAARQLKIAYQNISIACKNEKRSAGGFIWKFI